jgi:hypothetical protein
LLARGWWFSLGTPPSSTTKTGCHDIAEILLKEALNTKMQFYIGSYMDVNIISPLIGENVTCGAIEKLHCFVDTPKIVLAWQQDWVRARLCKLQKRVHSTRSRK